MVERVVHFLESKKAKISINQPKTMHFPYIEAVNIMTSD